MTPKSADVIICGAGICGISAAYHLTAKQGLQRVILVDERDPMSFTSDKSTECYRNWWPGPGDTMVAFMNHSIDLLEALALESNNYFSLNRRGYAFVTADPAKITQYEHTAREIGKLGAGPLRIHRGSPTDPVYTPSPPEGFQNLPTGADLLLDKKLINQTFPFISDDIAAILHVRRCGWLSAQQLGAYLLQQGRANGVELVNGRLEEVSLDEGRVRSVFIRTGQGKLKIQADKFVIAAGPFQKQVASLIGVDLPVYNELHPKVAFKDNLGVIPPDAPLMIWDDPLHLYWNDHEIEELAAYEDTSWLLDRFPAGVHFRPEGSGEGSYLLGLWTYDIKEQEPVPDPVFDQEYPEIILRGLVRMVPGLKTYLNKMNKPSIDGGYYCKTRENRPLICPLPVNGAYLFGAISGFGIMGAMAGGELLAKHVTGDELPDYAEAFLLSRYDDPEYQELLKEWESTSGQL